MYNKFANFFNVSSIQKYKDINFNIIKNKDILNLLLVFNGESFGNGLYRIHNYKEINYWNSLLGEIFPNFKNKIICFGYDWLGRQFALYNNIILMFEAGTGEVLEIPFGLEYFHNIEITECHEDCLASPFFNNWIKSYGKPLKHNECASYKIPLFLNGEDEIHNLEVANIVNYWEFIGQLLKAI